MYRDFEKQKKWHRENKKKRYYRWRAAGACGKCGEPCGKYALCFRHREKQAAYKRKKRKEKKDARKQRISTVTRADERNS